MIFESEGIVLYFKKYKEYDKLITIFTKTFGKLVFFVKNDYIKKNSFSILPFSKAIFIGNFNKNGFSFLKDIKEYFNFKIIQNNFLINIYATYCLELINKIIKNYKNDYYIYNLFDEILKLFNKNKDVEIITNILEVKLFKKFNFIINWNKCKICNKENVKFNYSSKFNGLLCEQHFYLDKNRYKINPIGIYFINLFNKISLSKIKNINVCKTTKKIIRKIIDEIYFEYIGINLKSKKIIDLF